MASVYIILGSNIGDKATWIKKAITEVSSLGQIKHKSHLYETDAWGGQTQESFYNQCILLETEFSPLDLLEQLLQIEQKLGRIRNPNQKYGQRTIDLDILFYDYLVINSPKLELPHPRLHRRKFVLYPLEEIAKNYIHPILKKSIQDLLNECTDTLEVKKTS